MQRYRSEYAKREMTMAMMMMMIEGRVQGKKIERQNICIRFREYYYIFISSGEFRPPHILFIWKILNLCCKHTQFMCTDFCL